MNAEQHKLSDEEHERIFQEIVKPSIFRNATPTTQPTAVMFGGQPGAGKSAAVDQAVRELNEHGGCVEIIGDDLRPYHPQYSKLMAADDQTAAFYTDRDSGRWVQKCIEYAKTQRVNVVVEGTFRNPDVVAKTMKDFKAAGYVIDARILAVKSELSEQGIYQRYESQKATRGAGRMTTPEAHQAAYDGLPKTVAMVEREKLADRVTVLKRGPDVIYRNELQGGNWRDKAAAVEAVEAERARPLTLEEKAGLAQGYAKVLAMARARSAPVEQVDRLATLERNSVNAHKAAAFRELPHSDAVKTYSDLAGAYIALKSITENKPATTHPAFMEQVKAGLAAAIEEGRAVTRPELKPSQQPVRSNRPKDIER